MLARNFLTPAELNISDRQFEALLKVLGMLERGELPWHKEVKTTGNAFDMSIWDDPHCGSVGCIGYWAEKIGEVDFNRWDMSPGLSNLFFNVKACERPTKPEQAAAALRNFLATGNPNWIATLKG